jgi:hypothetical protein
MKFMKGMKENKRFATEKGEGKRVKMEKQKQQGFFDRINRILNH